MLKSGFCPNKSHVIRWHCLDISMSRFVRSSLVDTTPSSAAVNQIASHKCGASDSEEHEIICADMFGTL